MDGIRVFRPVPSAPASHLRSLLQVPSSVAGTQGHPGFGLGGVQRRWGHAVPLAVSPAAAFQRSAQPAVPNLQVSCTRMFS
jgi:hypothetical protein